MVTTLGVTPPSRGEAGRAPPCWLLAVGRRSAFANFLTRLGFALPACSRCRRKPSSKCLKLSHSPTAVSCLRHNLAPPPGGPLQGSADGSAVDEHGMTEFERERAARIALNRQRMEQLQLASLAQQVVAVAQPARPPPQRGLGSSKR